MGLHKGCPKTPGSGRKKESRNAKTLLQEELFSTFTTPDRVRILREKLFRDGYQGNINATRIWLDHTDKCYREEEIPINMSSFTEIKDTAQKVMDKIGKGSLSLTQGKELMAMLHEGAIFRKMAAEYAGEKIVLDTAQKRGHEI